MNGVAGHLNNNTFFNQWGQSMGSELLIFRQNYKIWATILSRFFNNQIYN